MSWPAGRQVVEIVPLCEFPAGALLWEAAPGQRSLTAIVKGTFTLAPGELVPALVQDPLGEERHWDDNGMASVYDPGSFAPSKRKVDVTLVGHAYAPGAQPVTSLVARLSVGDLDKSVRVTGDRAWSAGPEPGPPVPFQRLPLRYERAALSADNPLGIDPQAGLPNLASDGGMPCFGPIAPTWRARRRLVDESATFWAHGISRDPRLDGPPLGPAPPRFDFAFFNAAPVDQQVDLLVPGTPLALEALHPLHPHLVTRLPAVRPQVFRVPPDLGRSSRARVEEIILRCDSLWIDTDRCVAVLTWRGVADVGGPEASVGRLVVVADPDGKKLRWDRVEKLLGEPGSTLRLRPDTGGASALPDPLARRYDAVKGSPVDDGGLTRPQRALPPPNPPGEEPGPGSGIQDAPTNPLSSALPLPVIPSPRDERTLTDPPRFPGAPRAAAPRPAARTGGFTLRKDLTIEKYAEITAALAQKSVQRVGVLRAHLLTEAAWSLVDQTWKKILAAAAQEGDRSVADAYDDAYVAHQERLARPIDLAAYARLQIAVERGAVGQILADLDLELGDLVRLQRVWARRAAASPETAAALAQAVGEARR